MSCFHTYKDDDKTVLRGIVVIILISLILITAAVGAWMAKLDGSFFHPKAGEKYRYLDNGNPFEPKLTNQVICYSNHWVLYSNYSGYIRSQKESIFFDENTLIK